METIEFLKAILPDDCWYFIAVPSSSGKGFKHFACQSLGEAAARAKHLDEEQAQNVYFACAGFRDEFYMGKGHDGKPKKMYRVHENVKLVKAFWLDLDVGVSEPGKPPKYDSQTAAIMGLGQFLKNTGLPKPMVVNSGYGVHVYWPLDAAIMPGQWTHTATMFKALTKGAGLHADATRTSDPASVLRPVGTHNRKVKNEVAGAMPVTCTSTVEPVSYAVFHEAVERAVAKLDVEVPKERKTTEGVNPSGLIVPVGGFQKSNADKVAMLCQQIRSFKDTGGASEPQWYGALQVIAFCDNGQAKVHEWSKKYNGYSESETQSKLDQIRSFGPTTCAKLEDIYSDACRGCKYKGRITSPIQLGIEIKEAAVPTIEVVRGTEIVSVELPPPPIPFKRGDASQPGLYVEIEGTPIRFYPYDLYPIELCKDIDMGYEITRVRHHLPHEGWGEFTFRSSLVASAKEFTTALMDNSIKPENVKYMGAYMNSYLQELQSKTKIRKLYGSMGWKEEGFLLGRKLYTKDSIQSAGVSSKVSHELVDSITTGGTLEGWQAGIQKLDQPGLEAHLFSFLVGFGAPLFSITGFDGAMLSMLGDTNSGKTLSSKAMLSIWGKYKGLRIGKKDTLNAKVEKMAMLGNLPVYIDELTNTDADELSQFVYQISEGRGRSRLRSDSTMRDAVAWQTLGITSTNASLVSKLATGKDNAEAELARILEYRVEKMPWFEPQMSDIHNAVTDNYGWAGERYVEWLVRADRAALQDGITKVVQDVMGAVTFEGKERFWMNTIGAVLYGAVIAQSIGILGFHDFTATYRRMFTWCCGLIHASRHELVESHVSHITVLGQFLDASMGSRLVVNDMKAGHSSITAVVKQPTNALTVRVEQHNGNIFIDRKVLKKYLVDRQIDYTPMKQALAESGVLLSADKDKTLGAGTSFKGTQVHTWWIDGNHPDLKAHIETPEETT